MYYRGYGFIPDTGNVHTWLMAHPDGTHERIYYAPETGLWSWQEII